MRHAVSSLSIGDAGWTQIANFLITGSLVVAFSFGLRTSVRSALAGTWAPRLVGLAGVGLIGAGVCVSDPVFGYPSSLPLRVAQFTTHGHLHDLFSMFFFVGIPSACISRPLGDGSSVTTRRAARGTAPRRHAEYRSIRGTARRCLCLGDCARHDSAPQTRSNARRSEASLNSTSLERHSSFTDRTQRSA